MTFSKKIFAMLFAALIATSVNGQTQDGPIPEELELRVVARHYSDISDSAGWELKAEYPEVRLNGDIPAEKFNEMAKKIVMDGVLDFKYRMSQMSAEERDHLPDGVNLYYEAGFTVEYLSDNFVSVNFSISEFTGGAHPNHNSLSLNYDLENQSVVKLDELFVLNSNYLDVISKTCIDQLKKDQGENGSNDWIEGGAGPKLENFENWNVTKEGLKFAFDPYVVGPYSAGRQEIVVPFEKFADGTRKKRFEKIVSSISDQEDDRFMCRNGLFTNYQGAFSIGTVKMAKGEKISRTYFYDDSTDCPDGEDCRLKSYVISNDQVIVAETAGGFYCAWYQPKKGSETVGWIRKHELNIGSPNPEPSVSKWLGNWDSDGNSLEIRKDSKPGVFKITGNAFWRGVGDNIHIGEVDDSGTPIGNRLNFGGPDKYDCRVKMTLINDLLVVSDNMMCGGANVTFGGVYQKKR